MVATNVNRNNSFFRIPLCVLHLGKFCKRYEKLQKKPSPKKEALEYVRFEARSGSIYAVATDGSSLVCLYWKLDSDEKLHEPIHVHHSSMCILEDDGQFPCIHEVGDTYTNRAGQVLVVRKDVEFPDWRYTISECSKKRSSEKTIDLAITEKWTRFVSKFGTHPNVKVWVRRGVIMSPYRYDGITGLADNTKAVFVQMPSLEPREYILPTFS